MSDAADEARALDLVLAWRELAAARGALLICYRLRSSAVRAGSVIDRVTRAEQRLRDLGEDPRDLTSR